MILIYYICDTIESLGFKWNGINYTCGFYRIRNYNSYYYLEKWIGYKYHRVIYKSIFTLYVSDVSNSWFDKKVNEEEYNKFISEIKKAARESKLKRLDGFFKYDESHYSHLHAKNN